MIMWLSSIGGSSVSANFQTQDYSLDCIRKRDFYLDLLVSVFLGLSFSALKQQINLAHWSNKRNPTHPPTHLDHTQFENHLLIF